MSNGLNDRLLCVLRDKTGTMALDYKAEPEALTGGFWAELVAFALVGAPAGWQGELVARVMPDPLLAAKETAVQAAVAAAGVSTPAVRGAGGPDDGLGRAFMVMDRADGVPLLAGLDGAGALLGGPRRLWRMPDVLASVMATLHAVDPASVRAQLEHVDVASTVPALVETLGERAVVLGRTDLADAAAWLLEYPRSASEVVICHGDLHPFNVLLAADGELTVLDWTAAVIGPRAYDVAFTSLLLGHPPVAVPGALRPLIRGAGRGLAARFVRAYQRHSGVRVDPADVKWHQAVVALRTLVEVAGWVHDGVVESRAGHPWLLSGEPFAARLSDVTGVPVRPR